MECPCIDCIIFVMCKYRLMKEIDPQVMRLARSCPHLQDYILESDRTLHTIAARKIFGLMDWGDDNHYEEVSSVG